MTYVLTEEKNILREKYNKAFHSQTGLLVNEIFNGIEKTHSSFYTRSLLLSICILFLITYFETFFFGFFGK